MDTCKGVVIILSILLMVYLLMSTVGNDKRYECSQTDMQGNCIKMMEVGQ